MHTDRRACARRHATTAPPKPDPMTTMSKGADITAVIRRVARSCRPSLQTSVLVPEVLYAGCVRRRNTVRTARYRPRERQVLPVAGPMLLGQFMSGQREALHRHTGLGGAGHNMGRGHV